MKTLTLMFLLVVCALPAFADKKDRDWKTGKVIDTESHGYTTYGGTTTNGQVNNDGSYRGTSTPATWHHKEYTFAVEGEDMIYVASHTLSFRWSKEASVTVNAPIQYAVEKNNLYILDEKGREFKLHIEKKILKVKSAPKP